MTTIRQSLMWSGSGAVLSMFVVTSVEIAPALRMGDDLRRPERVRSFRLEAPPGVLPGRHVVAYDAAFATVPEPLSSYLEHCLREAVHRGAEIAWFGFEGSFHFDHLLTSDIADQVYAIADRRDLLVVADAMRRSDEWAERVVAMRTRFLATG